MRQKARQDQNKIGRRKFDLSVTENPHLADGRSENICPSVFL